MPLSKNVTGFEAVRVATLLKRNPGTGVSELQWWIKSLRISLRFKEF